ncbi:MAG: hydroxylamine reductase [Desulfovibrionaceae bacterium]|nr:hydroxylamine reductase [Desulfovibrionaceae bacterium]
MFCYQCQETAQGTGCTKQGVCGKTAEVAALQDVLIYVTKGLSAITTALRQEKVEIDRATNFFVTENLFTTITNANFDSAMLEKRIEETVALSASLRSRCAGKTLPDAALCAPKDHDEMLACASKCGVLATVNEDVRSLRELITYGLKGLAAYSKHANVLGYYDDAVDAFTQETLAALLDDSKSVEDLIALSMATGQHGVTIMALLDRANTETYGNPCITSVSLGVGTRPGILISGHDLKDLEMLLEQAEGSGVDIYTHGEMLAAHYYPKLAAHSALAGNYGNAWWKQKDEFESFNGPILMTTNCVVPPKASYKERLFTTGPVYVEGCQHIDEQADGSKDFSSLIALAKTCPPPKSLESGTLVGGFAHHQVLALADTVIAAVKSGAIKRFVVMAGCDGRHKSRAYYEDFAKKLPQDTVILTAGCAKYKYIKLDLGKIGDIPRVLDAGQCNDSYSLVRIALALKDAFGCKDVNELPIVYNIAWYEQKAVIVLLALLFLGVKNIHLGPTLPAFLSKTVASYLVEHFGIAGITDVENDLKVFKLS